jgi:hypothetical protein
MRLTKNQRELFDAMKAGVVVRGARTREKGSFCFRADTKQPCIAAVHALARKGLAKAVVRADAVYVLTGLEPRE